MRNHGEGVSGSNLGQTQSHQACNQVDWHSIASHLNWVSGFTARNDTGVDGGSIQGWRVWKLGSHKGYLAQTPQQSPSRSLHRGTPFRKKDRKKEYI